MTDREPICTVIILTARRLALLEKCLASLQGQTRPPSRVVVVCTDPADGSGEWIAGHDFGTLVVETVPLSPGGSFAEARNQGVTRADSDWVAFLDDDCEADRFWLERLLDKAVGEELDAVGGMVLPADELEAPENYHPDLCWAVGLLPEGFLGPLGGRRYLPSTSNLMARCELLKSHPFQEIGGKRGDYHFGREDADWWRHVRRRGFRTGVAPRALVWHHVPQDRLDPETILERLRADGAAHWAREKNAAPLSDATRDVLSAPVGALMEWSQGRLPLGEIWANRKAWAARQAAWMEAAVSDYSPTSIDPMRRSEAYVLEGAGLLFDGVKATSRYLLGYGLDAWRGGVRREELEFHPSRPLVVLHDNLGDAVLALPMLRQLCEGLEGGRVTVLCGKAGYQILEANLPEEVTLLQIPDEAKGSSPRAIRAMTRFLEDFDADVQILAYAHGLSPLPFFARRVPIVAWDRDNGLERKLWRSQIDFPVEKSWEKSEVAALLDLLAPLGISTRLERPWVMVDETHRQWREELLEEHAPGVKGYVVVQGEDPVRYKDWPPEKIAALSRGLASEGMRVFLIGGPSGLEKFEEICGDEGAVTILNGQMDGMELAALLEGAKAFVGVDSGPGHLAHAVGCPALILFGRTIVHRWEPLPPLRKETEEKAPHTTMIWGKSDLLDEEIRGLPVNFGMEQLGVDPVLEATFALINRVRN